MGSCGGFKTIQLSGADSEDPAILPSMPFSAAALPATLKRIDLPTYLDIGDIARLLRALPPHAQLKMLGLLLEHYRRPSSCPSLGEVSRGTTLRNENGWSD